MLSCLMQQLTFYYIVFNKTKLLLSALALPLHIVPQYHRLVVLAEQALFENQ